MTRKAVIVAPWFGVNSGGAEAALLKIAEGLRLLDHEVEIWTTRSMAPYGDWLENPEPDPQERIAGFPLRRFAVDETGFDRYQAAVAALSRGARPNRNLRDDFFRYGMTSSALVAALGALPPGVRIVGGPYYQALIHNVVAALPGRVFVMPASHDEEPFHFEAVGRLLRDARGLLLLTQSEKELVIRHHGAMLDRAKLETPVLSLPYLHGTAGPETPGADGSGPPRSDLLRTILGRFMLYVGRIDEGKNIGQLVQWHHQAGLERMAGGQAPVTLLLAGKGAGLTFDSPFVRPLGFVTEAEKRALIGAALGLVNLSLNESFSFVLFEAWQAGVPVIVHKDCAVTRAHVDRGKGGFSCDTAADYAAALREFERPALRAVLAGNGRRYADRTCDFDGFISRLARITAPEAGVAA